MLSMCTSSYDLSSSIGRGFLVTLLLKLELKGCLGRLKGDYDLVLRLGSFSNVWVELIVFLISLSKF